MICITRPVTQPNSMVDDRVRRQKEAMINSILENTLGYLKGLPELSKRQIVELHLSRYFTTVELDDGSVGSCMSYYWLPDSTLAEAELQIAKLFSDNPFAVADQAALTEALGDRIPNDAQRHFLFTSVAASMASALSARLLTLGGNSVFEVVKNRPADWVDGVETALVIGFGGYLEPLAAERTISKLHVLDLTYDQRRADLDAQLSSYRQRFPGKSITVSTRLDGKNQLRDFDLVSITGSTLSNGSLEGILAEARNDSKLILQGQSASLYPKYLFQSGISWVATTIKPTALSKLARGDYSGKSLRPLLEGGLPWIYLVPRAH